MSSLAGSARMNIDAIASLLESGTRLGFKKTVSEPDYLGWILFYKLQPNPRVLELFDEGESPQVVSRERAVQLTPFVLQRIELRRAVHEGGGYETDSDYRMRETYRFAELVEVARQLEEWGYRLEDARDMSELDAP